MTLAQVAPAQTPTQGENDALVSLLETFDNPGQDERKLEYLQHRYAGFTRRESATLTGVSVTTSNKWLKDDPRMAHYDGLVSTGKRKDLRKDVLQADWFRNFHLVLQQDAYILKKVHGLLKERFLEVTSTGERKWTVGSPAMRKEDWDYFSQMRKMYTPDAWASIEKAISGQTGTFNINEFILTMNTQINNNAP